MYYLKQSSLVITLVWGEKEQNPERFADTGNPYWHIKDLKKKKKKKVK